MDLSSGKLRWLRVATLVAGVAVLVSACGTSSTGTGENIKNGGTLIWALDADAQSLNPFVAGDVPSVRAYGFLFPNIYQADKNLNIQPDLADGMPSISSDKKVWTVKLRKAAKWSDGSPITADDVVMTVNMQNNPNLDTDAAFDWGELDKVEAVDANTVMFTLKDVFAPFQANTLLTFVAPASVYGKIDPAKQRTDPVSLNPTVTGGPYKFDKRVAGSEIDYVANTNYYLGRPHYDKAIAKVITDATAATNALINGDVAWHPALGEGGSGAVTKAKAASGVQVHDYADLGYIDMRLNTRKGHLFDNVLTRQAMATALDKPSIVDAAMDGRGRRRGDPTQPERRCRAKVCRQDPGARRQAAADQGRPDHLRPAEGDRDPAHTRPDRLQGVLQADPAGRLRRRHRRIRSDRRSGRLHDLQLQPAAA